MKTIFKVGMTVYDQIVFPDVKGKVVDIEKFDDFPIKVHHEGLEENISYTEDGRYYSDIEPTLSTKPYTLQGFEQKASTPTYHEVLKKAIREGNYYYLPDCLEVPSEELCDATIALLKLLFLRDYYNEGWQPNWRDESEEKYSIGASSNKLFATKTNRANYILTFREESIRDKFLEEQKELLEIAKPLL